MLRTLQRLFLFVILKMHKSIFTCFILILSISCNTKNEKGPIPAEDKNNISVIPITEFLKGQLKEIENSPVTPVKITIEDGKVDSIWVTRDSIRTFAGPFLTPEIDSASLSSYFEGTSFFDQSVNAVTLTYEANSKIPEGINLRHMDIYIRPEQNEITRVYMVKEIPMTNGSKTLQLTWNPGKNCSKLTIIEENGKEPRVKEENIIWGF